MTSRRATPRLRRYPHTPCVVRAPRCRAIPKLARSLAQSYGWSDPFENSHGNERTVCNNLSHDGGDRQRALLGVPLQLLDTFRTAALKNATLRGQWAQLAQCFDGLSKACDTHRVGCKGVAPPRQALWANESAAKIRAFCQEASKQ